jgi:hypothetical protein
VSIVGKVRSQSALSTSTDPSGARALAADEKYEPLSKVDTEGEDETDACVARKLPFRP